MYVCILLLDEFLAAFRVPLSVPVAQSTHDMTKHHYFVTSRTVTVRCRSKLPPQAANEIIIAHKLTVPHLVQYFVFFVQLDSTLSPPNLT
jgi:hypothetical protein